MLIPLDTFFAIIKFNNFILFALSGRCNNDESDIIALRKHTDYESTARKQHCAKIVRTLFDH